MEFWNIAIPFLVFLSPVAACLYLALNKGIRTETEFKLGMAIWGGVIFLAIFGVFRFDSPVRIHSSWPFSADPSGYFEFVLHQRWTRYVWVLFVNAILLTYAVYEKWEKIRSRSTAFLHGASLLTSLAFLSENVLLSLLFIETAFFLLYAFSAQAGEREAELGRSSYFKRGSFIVLSLLALTAVSATGELSANSVLLLGVVLYALAFIFSRHGFSQWSHLFLSLIQGGAVFFLLGSIIGEDLPSDLWIPLAALFGVFSLAFALLSAASFSSLGSSFWMLFSLFGYLLFLRFSSGHPDEPFWVIYEAVSLIAVLAWATLFRFGQAAGGALEKGLSILLAILVLGVVSGAIPGVDTIGAKASADYPVRMACFGVLTFFLALIIGKAMAVAYSKKEKIRERPETFLAAGLVPAIGLILFQVAAVAKITDLNGESPYRMGFVFMITSPHVVTASSAILAGFLAGLLLGSHSGFLGWISNGEKKMEDLFPSVNPVIVAWNGRLAEIPERGLRWISLATASAFDRVAIFAFNFDNTFFREKFFNGFKEYGSSLSLFVRYFHSGNIRAYLFVGVVITIFASVLFLMEGQ